MQKRAFKIVFVIVLVFGFFATIIYSLVPFGAIFSLPNTINLSYDDFDTIQNSQPFGKLVNISLSKFISTSQTENNQIELHVKLFDFLVLKKVNVNVNNSKVFAGGNTVGFSLNSSGVIVVGNSAVTTESGIVDTLKGVDIKNGDILLELDGEKVNRISDLSKILNKEQYNGGEIVVKIKRKNEILERKLTPAKDSQSHLYKLGLWVKDDASGVGTLTFVRQDNSRFGALGHAICDPDTKQPFEINSGDMYNSTVIGINKGQKNKPGELRALFVQGGSNSIAQVDKNCKYGVFGTYLDTNKLDTNSLMEVGGRFTAKPGKAKIRTCLDSGEFKEYEIEIIKTNYQNSSSDKSMVFRVTDKELIKKTGGIVQGMSGSPILQNGKIIGAVTHVFVSDPTKGFGIYLDWMINE